MEKNWYIIYTKPGCESKVASYLTKKKIENFLPLCQNSSSRSRRITRIPLFPNYVFVNISATQLQELLQIPNVLSLVYWKGRWVTVPQTDIENIYKFIAHNSEIRIRPISIVDKRAKKEMIAPPELIVKETLATTENPRSEISLPSLGYILVAESKSESFTKVIFSKSSNEKVLTLR